MTFFVTAGAVDILNITFTLKCSVGTFFFVIPYTSFTPNINLCCCVLKNKRYSIWNHIRKVLQHGTTFSRWLSVCEPRNKNKCNDSFTDNILKMRSFFCSGFLKMWFNNYLYLGFILNPCAKFLLKMYSTFPLCIKK